MTANRKETKPNRPAVERGFLHSALGVAARSNDDCHVTKGEVPTTMGAIEDKSGCEPICAQSAVRQATP
ncbi:MAG: hypothetical protein K2N05_05550 [Muribaculaceae bacterium]|nr:hypothetical protein [Muribaculaceae bacterium]